MAEIVIAFDLYGTLLSTESISAELSKMYGDEKAKAMAARARTLQLEYTWRSNSMKTPLSFSQVTRWSFRHAAAEQGLSLSPADEERVMAAYNGLETFSDAEAGLRLLAGPTAASDKVRVYVLSNGDGNMLESSVSTSPALAAVLPPDRIVSVEPLAVFKPDPAVYRHLAEVAGSKGSGGDGVWLVSSNAFDVCGAVAAGLRSVWVDRAGQGWVDGLGVGAGYSPTMVVRGVDEAIKEIIELERGI